MRVLTLATLFPDASRPTFGVFVERQTLGLAERADVEVIAPLGLPPWPLSSIRHRSLARLPQHERWKGLSVHRPRFLALPGTQGRFHASLLARAILPLARRLHAERRFDVIDAEFFFPDGPAATVLGKALGLPVSIKARGSDIHLWGRAPATASQVLEAGQAAAGLLAVSQAMRDDMIALGMPAPEVHHTGVDQSRFAPGDRAALKARLGVDGPLVVSVGTLSARKGQRIVAEAVARLPGVTLALIGDGPDRAALEGKARLLGTLPHDEVASWLAAADIMALASASEGLANAWVEALASGTPIVIPDVGGAREVVTGPAAGRLVARTPEAFAEAIEALLADPPAQSAVRAHAERFTWGRNTDALIEHLTQLVDPAKAGAPAPPRPGTS